MLSQQGKILTLMIRSYPDKQWFHAYDFMPPHIPMAHECCVGYEASARLSQLCKRYPELFEVKQDGKYRMARIRLDEPLPLILKNLNKELKEVFAKECSKRIIGDLKVDTI